MGGLCRHPFSFLRGVQCRFLSFLEKRIIDSALISMQSFAATTQRSSTMHSDFHVRPPDLSQNLLRSRYGSIWYKDTVKVLDLDIILVNTQCDAELIQMKATPNHSSFGFILEFDSKTEFYYTKQSGDIINVQLPQMPGAIIDFELSYSDSSSIYILWATDSLRPDTLYRIDLPSIKSSSRKHPITYPVFVDHPVLVVKESDAAFFLSITRSKTNSLLLLVHHQSKSSSQVSMIREPTLSATTVISKQHGVQVFATHAESSLIAIVTDRATGFKLMATSDTRVQWRQLWPCDDSCHSTSHAVEEYDVFSKTVIIYGKSQGLPMITWVPLDTPTHACDLTPQLLLLIPTLPSVYEILPALNASYNAEYAEFSITSIALPEIDCRIHLASGEISLISGSLPSSTIQRLDDFTTTRIAFPSTDGTLVPLTIVTTKGQPPGARPMLLSVYGAYGKSLPMHYNPFYEELLRRGWLLGFVHARGGGELGQQWRVAGNQLCKWNTFNDFNAAATYVIAQSYTTSRLLCGEGSSAGGLVLGVAANTLPHSFAGFIFRNAFLNISDAVVDKGSPLCVHEQDEWGDAGDPQVADYISSYCPMANIRIQRYPAMLVVVSASDRIVPPENSRLWVERIVNETSKTRLESEVILRENNYDHMGSIDPKTQLQEAAVEIAFLTKCVS